MAPRKKKSSKVPLLILAILIPIAAGLAIVLVLQRTPTVAQGGTIAHDDVAQAGAVSATAAPAAANTGSASPNPTATTTPITEATAPVVTPPPVATIPDAAVAETPTTKTEPKIDPKKKTHRTHTKTGGAGKSDDDDDDDEPATVEPKVEPKLEEPKVEKTEPKVEPKKVEPKTEVKVKPVDTRTAVVAANAVTKLSGELPAMRVAASDASVTAKLCIGENGSVSSVKLVKAPPEVADDLSRALATWRYKPYLNSDSKASAACFIVSLRLVVK